MGIITWIVFGLIVGVVAKFIMPGPGPGGIIVTILLGIVGAVLGGYIGHLFGLGDLTGFNLHSMLLAVGGALLLLIAYRLLRKG